MILSRILTLLIIILPFTTAFAQQHSDSTVDVRTKERPGIFWYYSGLDLSENPKVPKYDRFIFDIKYNDLANFSPIKLFNTNWRSIGFNTQFVFDIPMNKANTVSFGIGIGYEFGKYQHENLIVRDAKQHFFFADSLSDEKKILRTHTFFVPVEFRFRTKGYQHFKFHIGSNIGYRFGNDKRYFGETTIKTKTGGMANFEWLYLDLHARIGIRNWAVIVSANLLPIFRNTTIKTYPVSLGISISLS